MWRIVTTDFPPLDGGIATWTEAVAAGLAAAGEEVAVHARVVAGLRARSRAEGAPYDVVPMWGRSWAAWQGVWAAASVLPRLRRGDKLLCATWPLAVHLLGPARRLGVPVGVAFHGSDLTRAPVVRGLDLVRAEATALLPVSRYLGGLLDAPHVVLPAPVDPLPAARPGEALLTVARLTPLKGVDRVLRLGHRLGRPVVVVGEGDARPGLEALAAELGVSASFTGRLPRADIPWDDAWACALLSRPDPADARYTGAEGLGLVLLEAAARGIPTLGSTTGGVPEAAAVVLADPERDPIPPLPDRAAMTAWLAAHHGTDRLVATLRAALTSPG